MRSTDADSNMADIEKHLLQVLDKDGVVEDSEDFASTSGTDHKAIVSSIKSLQSYEMIIAEVLNKHTLVSTITKTSALPLPVCHDDHATTACRKKATPGLSLHQKVGTSVSMVLQSSECTARSRGMKGVSP